MNKSGSPKILMLSSVDPYKGVGRFALKYWKALEEAGMEVDFLTDKSVEGHPEIFAIDQAKPYEEWGYWARRRMRHHRRELRHKLEETFVPPNDYGFCYPLDWISPVFVPRMLSVLPSKRYDAVIPVFWEGMISMRTLEETAKAVKGRLMMLNVDFQPATGGCHFIVDCDRYNKGCSDCLVFRGMPDVSIPGKTIAYRRKMVRKLQPSVMCNAHMERIYKQGSVFVNYPHFARVYPIIDNDLFRPATAMERKTVRERLGIPEDAFVLFFGSQLITEKRKGISYLMKALKGVSEKNVSNKIHLLVVGTEIDKIENEFPFPYTSMGMVEFERLPDLYRASDLYLSPTIGDAGPTMVNFALSSGVPVVAFPVGTALDMIAGREKETGYIAQLADSIDFANGIMHYLEMPDAEYVEVAANCRQTALELTSGKNFAQTVTDILTHR